MTTNKPEVVAYATHHDEPLLFPSKREAAMYCDDGEEPLALIHISDYEALQAEREKLRNLLRHAQPIIRAHAEASHMLEGFRPRRNQWDELAEGIDAAIQEGSHDNQ